MELGIEDTIPTEATKNAVAVTVVIPHIVPRDDIATEPYGIPIVIPSGKRAALCYECMRPKQFCICEDKA